jgi:hypothetical protein
VRTPITVDDYLVLLDWTARLSVKGKRGKAPDALQPLFERLSLNPQTWCQLVSSFGKLYSNVAGSPATIEAAASRVTQRRFHLRSAARALFEEAPRLGITARNSIDQVSGIQGRPDEPSASPDRPVSRHGRTLRRFSFALRTCQTTGSERSDGQQPNCQPGSDCGILAKSAVSPGSISASSVISAKH